MSLPVHIFTDITLQREFQCLICQCVISQCYSTQCGHLFCSKCIMNQLSPPSSSEDSSTDSDHPPKQYGQCPVCKRLLKVGDIFPAPYVDQKIAQQIIRCIYYHKGCSWTGTCIELKKKNGHLKQCGYTLYTCKYCKEKIIRNQMVRHQNNECKSQYMVCPYSMYGCNFECRIREMEKHCKVNELKHVKLKLDYLENQLFVPEIIQLKGMTGFNNQYIESNGKYYLINKKNKKNKSKYNNHHNNNNINANINALKPITYKKNGGYTLEFNQIESIWHLRSLYYGLIAYGMPKNIKMNEEYNQSAKQLNNFMNDNCVWSVYFKHHVKQSLIIDNNVRVQTIQISDNMMKWNVNEETDTEEINGEFEQQNYDYYGEGVIINKNNNNNNNNNHQNKNNHNNKRIQPQPAWYHIIFGGDSSYPLKRKKLTARKMEIFGIIALTGIAVYYLWSKFRSHPVPAVTVLQTKTGILIPSNFVG